MSDTDFATFVQYALGFFVHANKIWHKDTKGLHKLVSPPAMWLLLLEAAHDDVAHKGFYATNALISLR